MTAPLIPILPRWATGTAADVTEPLEAKKDTGWVGGATPDRPAAQHVNWLLKQNYEAHLWWLQMLIMRPSSDWLQASNPFPGMDADTVVVNQVAYSSSLDLFVAVGEAVQSSTPQRLVSSSPDLSTWTIRQQTATSGSPGYTGVRWDPTLAMFVVFGASTGGTGPALAFSTNGTAWTGASTTGFSSPIQDANYDPVSGLWTVIDNTLIRTCPTMQASPVWTTRATVGSGQLKSIAIDRDNGIIVICNNNPAQFRRSTNGTSYSTVSLVGSYADIPDVVWDDVYGKFLAVGAEITTRYPALAYSTTGASGTWTEVDSATLGVEENLAPYRIGLNPDYGQILIGTYPSRVFGTMPYSDMPLFERESPIGAGLWTGVSNSNYFRPLWNEQPASKVSRFWLLGGNSVGSGNLALAESQTPIY